MEKEARAACLCQRDKGKISQGGEEKPGGGERRRRERAKAGGRENVTNRKIFLRGVRDKYSDWRNATGITKINPDRTIEKRVLVRINIPLRIQSHCFHKPNRSSGSLFPAECIFQRARRQPCFAQRLRECRLEKGEQRKAHLV